MFYFPVEICKSKKKLPGILKIVKLILIKIYFEMISKNHLKELSMSRKIFLTALAVLFLIIVSPPSTQAALQSIHYQGRLRVINGALVNGVTRYFKVSYYNSQVGGTLFWADGTCYSSAVSYGNFELNLSTAPASLGYFDATNYWMTLQMYSNSSCTTLLDTFPREQISASPIAITSSYLSGISGSGTNILGDARIGYVTNDNGSTVGYGNRLYFSDSIYISRYNSGSDYTELRVNIGDNASQAADKFVVGTTDPSWTPRLTAQMNGYVGINKGSPEYPLDVAGSGSNYLARFQSPDGYLLLGPANSGWAHLATDRARFYMNTGLTVDTGNIGSYNENLSLQTSGTTRFTILNSNGNIGIDDTTPSHKLDVNGDIAMKSDMRMNTSFSVDNGTLSIFNDRIDDAWDYNNFRICANSNCSYGFQIETSPAGNPTLSAIGQDFITINDALWLTTAQTRVINLGESIISDLWGADGTDDFVIHGPGWDGSSNNNYGTVVGGHFYSYGGMDIGSGNGRLAGQGQLYVQGLSTFNGDIVVGEYNSGVGMLTLYGDYDGQYSAAGIDMHFGDGDLWHLGARGSLDADPSKAIKFWFYDDPDAPDPDSWSNPLTINPPGNTYVVKVNGAMYATSYACASDENLKKDIEGIDGKTAIEKFKQINGVNFKWREGDESLQLGVIAQDVEKVFPEAVKTDENTGFKSVNYDNLVAPLIEAVKEQQREIEALQREIEDLKNN